MHGVIVTTSQNLSGKYNLVLTDLCFVCVLTMCCACFRHTNSAVLCWGPEGQMSYYRVKEQPTVAKTFFLLNSADPLTGTKVS